MKLTWLGVRSARRVAAQHWLHWSRRYGGRAALLAAGSVWLGACAVAPGDPRTDEWPEGEREQSVQSAFPADEGSVRLDVEAPAPVSAAPATDAVEQATDCSGGCADAGPVEEPDPDGDGDGVPDPVDGCPEDGAKLSPGVCGCGSPDVDSDADGAFDCWDGCPQDGSKQAEGVCGCGHPDVDSDADGVVDCLDGCPVDGAKQAAGACGCGLPDTDADGDGVAACEDACDGDPAKVSPDACGCGLADVDADGNGTPDCLDAPVLPVATSQLGRTMQTTAVYIDGVATTHAEVTPGASVTLRLVGSVTDSEQDCGSCVTQFYARISGALSLCMGSGTSDWAFDESVVFTAPSTPGVYFVNPASSWQFECVPGTDAGATFGSGTMATVVVR